MFLPVGTHDQGPRIIPFTVSTLLKNESVSLGKVPFTVSTSLKNESVSLRMVPITKSTSLKNDSGMRTVLFLCQPH